MFKKSLPVMIALLMVGSGVATASATEDSSLGSQSGSLSSKSGGSFDFGSSDNGSLGSLGSLHKKSDKTNTDETNPADKKSDESKTEKGSGSLDSDSINSESINKLLNGGSLNKGAEEDSTESETLKSSDAANAGDEILIKHKAFWKGDSLCSLGAILSNSHAITARHCGDVGDKIYHNGNFLGTVTRVNTKTDIGHIALSKDAKVVVSKLNYAPLVKGQKLYKIGRSTGKTWGIVTKDKEESRTPIFAKERLVRETTMHMAQGDSGGAVFNEKDEVVAITSAMTFFSLTISLDGTLHSYVSPLALDELG